MGQSLPLSDVTVLELAGMIPGPYATMLMADLGAEVVKVEEPSSGDYQRQFGPETDGVNHRFANYNRNKRSIAIDLKTDRGREVLLDLAEESDVFLEGFRPGVVDRLGIGYDDVSARNPGIVYCSLSGYGQDGPYREWVGHDINYLGIAGLLSMTGERDGPPVPPGYPVSDFAGGLFAAFAIVSALRHRDRTGEGDYVDVSMTDVVASWGSQLLAAVAGGDDPRRGETLVSGVDPAYSVYECADGEYVTVGALEPQFWEALCRALSLEEYVDADRTDPEVREEVRAALAATFEQRPRDEWVERLDETEIPVGPVNSPREALAEDEQIDARDLVADHEVDGTTLPVVRSPYHLGSDRERIRHSAPAHGGDTESILGELGYDDDAVEDLLASGAVTRDD
jgi:alpha-methylacyl-CoA racemase